MTFVPATPVTRTDDPGATSTSEVAVRLCDGDAESAGLADEIVQAERLGPFRPPQNAEHAKDEAESDRAGDTAYQRGSARLQLEDLRPDKTADPEHRHEPEERRHERDAADMNADVKRVEHPTDDVVEHDGEQEEAAADGEAEDEDRIREIELEHPAPLPRADSTGALNPYRTRLTGVPSPVPAARGGRREDRDRSR